MLSTDGKGGDRKEGRQKSILGSAPSASVRPQNEKHYLPESIIPVTLVLVAVAPIPRSLHTSHELQLNSNINFPAFTYLGVRHLPLFKFNLKFPVWNELSTLQITHNTDLRSGTSLPNPTSFLSQKHNHVYLPHGANSQTAMELQKHQFGYNQIYYCTSGVTTATRNYSKPPSFADVLTVRYVLVLN